MIVQELHYDFDLKIDKVATLSKQDFTIAEKDWLLNEAQSVIIKKYYTGTNSSGAFETNQKRIDDLSTLVIKYPVEAYKDTLLVDGGVYEFPLRDLQFPYLFVIRGQVEVYVKGNTQCKKLAKLKFVQHDDLNHVLEDPFNKSDYSEVVYNIGRSSDLVIGSNNSSVYLYPGEHTLGKILIEYVKYPPRINYGGYNYIDGIIYPQQNCELPDHVHNELVDVAVEIASGIIESPNYVQLKREKVFLNS